MNAWQYFSYSSISKFAFLAMLIPSILPTDARATETIDQSFWDFNKFYQNDNGDYVHGIGRIHVDSVRVDSKEYGHFQDFYWRRFRFGLESRFDDITYTLDADFNLNNDYGDTFRRIADANVSFLLDSGARVKVFKQAVPFTLEGKTSSRTLLTPERSNLANNLWFVGDYFNGVTVTNTLENNWHYFAGAYLGELVKGISFDTSTLFGLFSIGRTYDANQYWDNALFSIDVLVNDKNPFEGNDAFSQVTSFSTKFERDSWGIWTDIGFGKGHKEQSDIWGYELMPYYTLNDKFQYVMRFTYIHSSDPHGIRQGRYDSELTQGRGDRYSEIYGGVNWYFNRHKLKLQLGLQYADMSDKTNQGGNFSGVALTTAFRLYW
ncbi:hypothetical protein LP316_13720 [Thalassotalea sp. LPB0316]|uniref:porin n=1 Tax=Thalassotalea sp. LPB0316 TaxID=2769490 RepID=UPI001868D93E|nr:porin [Thalassotalea sp. LPB0316]QOL25341.1 hypothetical protein LP316_13720 [Thalassotalea sp. LPB0316]